MARQGRKIEVVEVERLAVQVDIRFQKDSGRFTAEYQGQKWETTDLVQLRRDVQAAIEKSGELTWTPVMRVDVRADKFKAEEDRGLYYSNISKVAIDPDRFWVSRNPSGTDWLYCTWEVDPARRLVSAQKVREYGGHVENIDFDKLPVIKTGRYEGEQVRYYCAYTEEDWQKLQEAAEALGNFALWLVKCTSAGNLFSALTAVTETLSKFPVGE